MDETSVLSSARMLQNLAFFTRWRISSRICPARFRTI